MQSKLNLVGVVCLAVLSRELGGCSDIRNTPSAVEEAFTVNTAEAEGSQAVDRIDVSGTAEAAAKSAIIFVADGMGVSTVTAARIHAGQKAGGDGESHRLSFENFPHLSLVTTYNHDAQVPDSAGTATQMFSGYRARIGQLNVLPETPADLACDAPSPPTLAERAGAAGKRVGVVTTARLTHATPAAVWARSPDRGWEAPGDVPKGARAAGCRSIAEQLFDSGVDLALGGGRREFEGLLAGREVIGSLEEAGDGEMVLGFFADSHMSYEADRDPAAEPSLADMTTFAMDRLDNPDGYVLMVEAGRVDHAHHGTNAYRALEDMLAFDAAVGAAAEKAGDDTLILVTADHSHVFTIAGYPARGNPILGHVHGLDGSRERSGEPDLDRDGQPYTTLGYANGERVEGQNLAPEDPDYRQVVAVPLGSETHGGEDVPLYATGPGSERVRGAMDQVEIAGVVDAALGLGSVE